MVGQADGETLRKVKELLGVRREPLVKVPATEWSWEQEEGKLLGGTRLETGLLTATQQAQENLQIGGITDLLGVGVR